MKIQTEKQTVIARNVPPMRFIIAMFLSALLLAACGDDSENAGGTVEDGEVVAIVDKMISGVSQKGPFVNGSSVTVQELDGKTLAQTGLGFEGKIKNDLGEFTVKVNKLESQYALLKANGFYRNEVTGEKSKSQITLYALTDLSNRDEVNVNLLTHLAYERSLYLATIDTLSVAKAKKQAEAEIFKSFGIEGDFAAAEDLNIFGADDQSAALLAVSILMQSDLSEGDFSERLADYAADIESDGIWNDAKTATEIADWVSNRSLTGTLTAIRNNIAGWGLAADVPAFEKYVDRYWWQVYSLGFCDKDREGEVKAAENALSGNNGVHFICGDGAWRKATDIEKDTYKWESGKDGDVKNGDVVEKNCYVFEDSVWRHGNEKDCSLKLRGCTKLRQDTVGLGEDKVWYICDAQAWRNATDIEKDTATWGAGKNDGEIRKGQINKDSYYIYDADKKIWRNATTLEKDTYDYTNNRDWLAGTDGDVRYGDVVKTNCYVYEDGAWRIGNESDCSLELRGCTALRQDTVGLGVDDVWHICDANSWRKAKNIEKDTATWGAGAFDGEIRAGQINKTIYYVYETGNKSWRTATTLEKDTYDYTNNNGWLAGTDGEIKKGSITDSVYVYDVSVWRTADDVEKELGGCVAAIVDSVGKTDSTYYICTPRKWKVATVLQYDTYKHACTEFGQIIHGNVNEDYAYFCYGEYWKRFYGNEAKTYGKLVDERDGKIYRTIEIGEQIWMAENLNFTDSVTTPSLLNRNWCYQDVWNNNKVSTTYLDVAGRLYTWAAAMDSTKTSCGYGSACSPTLPVQGICPTGWHLPSHVEWNTLFTAVGGTDADLKSQSGWYYNGNGTDAAGFTALPIGGRIFNGLFVDEGYSALFWSSTEYDWDNEHAVSKRLVSEKSMCGSLGKKTEAYSVRCVKD